MLFGAYGGNDAAMLVCYLFVLEWRSEESFMSALTDKRAAIYHAAKIL
jgi:hypothetical protein